MPHPPPPHTQLHQYKVFWKNKEYTLDLIKSVEAALI